MLPCFSCNALLAVACVGIGDNRCLCNDPKLPALVCPGSRQRTWSNPQGGNWQQALAGSSELTLPHAGSSEGVVVAPKASRATAGGQSRSGKSAASVLDLLALEVLGTSTTQESRALAHSCLEVSCGRVCPTLEGTSRTMELSKVWHAALLGAAQ